MRGGLAWRAAPLRLRGSGLGGGGLARLLDERRFVCLWMGGRGGAKHEDLSREYISSVGWWLLV